MEEKEIRYPIGRQVFEEIREEGFLNVDKTEYVYRVTHEGALQLMQKELGAVSYCDNTHYEGHCQEMLYLIFTLLGSYRASTSTRSNAPSLAGRQCSNSLSPNNNCDEEIGSERQG